MIRKISKFLVIVTLCIAGSISYIRDINNSPSKYELASKKLGFDDEQQKALLKIYIIAGYFKTDKILQDLIESKIFGSDAKLVFDKELLLAIQNSRATESDPSSIDIDSLKHNLFGKSKDYFWKKSIVDIKQVEDWILYLAQNGFARSVGQERNELNPEDWMNKYKAEYIEAARILGLIDRKDPTFKEYDECWIAGANRLGTLTRILDFKNTILPNVTIKGETRILTGNRSIWAELDGISDNAMREIQRISSGISIDDVDIANRDFNNESSIKEGIEFIKLLAEKNNIKLNPQPVIKYSSKEECPEGLFPNRTYPNYANPSELKLTETLMAKYLLDSTLPESNFSIIDAKAREEVRTNTTSTTITAMEKFLNKLKDNATQKEYHILFVSNNPYLERQKLGAQREIDKILEKNGFKKLGFIVKLDGAGFGCKQDVSTIHSELGALISEKWLNHNEGRDNTNLIYQTRKK